MPVQILPPPQDIPVLPAATNEHPHGGRHTLQRCLSWLITPISPTKHNGRIRTCVAQRSPCFWISLASLASTSLGFFLAFGPRSSGIPLLIPIFSMGLRYLWWRLVWQPFGVPSGGGWCAETRDLCLCRNRRMYSSMYLVATVGFWLLLSVSVAGVYMLISKSTGDSTAEPLFFVVFCYNTAGAFTLLLVAVWIVDMVEFCLELGLAAVHFVLSGCCKKDSDRMRLEEPRVEMENGLSLRVMHLEDGSGTIVQHRQKDTDGNNNDSINKDTELVTRQPHPIPSNTPTDASNKLTNLFFSRLMAVSSLCLCTIMLILSSLDSYGDPRGVYLDLPLRKLPACLDGFRLALVTDVHAGKMTGPAEVQRITELLLNWAPDAVALVGDLGEQKVNAALRKKLDPLVALEAAVPHGVYWTPGNHEHYAGIEDYRAMFSRNTSNLHFVHILENSHRTIVVADNEGFTNSTTPRCSFDIAGLAETSGALPPDIDAALVGRSARDALVLLNHQPVLFEKYVEAGAGLMLSGHTHGGQVWPNHSIIWLVYGKYISGLFSSPRPDRSTPSSEGPAYLYVSEGAVGWGPRVRLLSYPDITYITLRNPAIFEAEGRSTSADERLRAAVVGLYLGLVALPFSIVLCILRSYGCCRHRGGAARAAFQVCGVESEHMHDV